MYVWRRLMLRGPLIVSHWRLVEIPDELGVDSYTRGLLHHWTRGRTFVLKHRKPGEVFYGRETPLTAGLPQAGPSPFPLADVLQWHLQRARGET